MLLQTLGNQMAAALHQRLRLMNKRHILATYNALSAFICLDARRMPKNMIFARVLFRSRHTRLRVLWRPPDTGRTKRRGWRQKPECLLPILHPAQAKTRAALPENATRQPICTTWVDEKPLPSGGTLQNACMAAS